MTIRRAQEKDTEQILTLLSQVLELHAKIRPDIFVSGTTKHDADELKAMITDDQKPIYVAVDSADTVVGYAFCQIKEQPLISYMLPVKSFFIDDLCVDETARGQHIGSRLFEYVKKEARRLGCYDVTLNVWAGNDSAEHFYEKMGMKTKERQLEFIL